MRYVCLLALGLAFSSLLPAKPPVPRPAAEFSCPDADGRTISLSKFKGKVVIAQFLITDCPHCQALPKVLTKLQNEFGPRGFQAFGVAINDATPEMVRSYVKDHQLDIPVGYAPHDQAIRYLGFSAVERIGVPQVMVIDRHGIVQSQSDPLGTPDLQNETYLRKLISNLLK